MKFLASLLAFALLCRASAEELRRFDSILTCIPGKPVRVNCNWCDCGDDGKLTNCGQAHCPVTCVHDTAKVEGKLGCYCRNNHWYCMYMRDIEEILGWIFSRPQREKNKWNWIQKPPSDLWIRRPSSWVSSLGVTWTTDPIRGLQGVHQEEWLDL